jgi:uncharacterized protein YecT (DUF1311 family)
MAAAVAAAHADSSRATAPATAKDRAAVESCLKLVAERVAAQAKRSEEPHQAPGAVAHLAGAAADAKSDPASCIGIVTNPCQEEPGGYSTPAMMACNERELAVWEERLDRLYRAALKSGGKEADAVRRAESAWVALRDARCALPAIQEEGGTAVGPLGTACQLEETARQAIWLESLDLGGGTPDAAPARP